MTKTKPNLKEIYTKEQHWRRTKLSWDAIIYKIIEANNVDDKKNLLLDYLAYKDIRDYFQNIFIKT